MSRAIGEQDASNYHHWQSTLDPKKTFGVTVDPPGHIFAHYLDSDICPTALRTEKNAARGGAESKPRRRVVTGSSFSSKRAKHDRRGIRIRENGRIKERNS